MTAHQLFKACRFGGFLGVSVKLQIMPHSINSNRAVSDLRLYVRPFFFRRSRDPSTEITDCRFALYDFCENYAKCFWLAIQMQNWKQLIWTLRSHAVFEICSGLRKSNRMPPLHVIVGTACLSNRELKARDLNSSKHCLMMRPRNVHKKIRTTFMRQATSYEEKTVSEDHPVTSSPVL